MQSNLLLEGVQDSNAHQARPRPTFRARKAVSRVHKFPQLTPPSQMAKCENCNIPLAASAIFRPGLRARNWG